MRWVESAPTAVLSLLNVASILKRKAIGLVAKSPQSGWPAGLRGKGMNPTLELNKDVMKAVESLDYRVTVGDVAAQAGLNIAVAEQGLLALASETQGRLQVSEDGEIAYAFSKNFRGVLRNKYWQLRFQETLAKIWQVLFYIVRVSFGVILMASIVVIAIAILALTIAMASQGGGGNNRDDRGGGGFFIFPSNFFYIFSPGYGRRRHGRSYASGRGASHRPSNRASSDLNFLEAIFSFLFGDGDPNADLEERRWRTIGTVIANNNGAVTAEQISPYLNDLGDDSNREYEDYMLPVLTRFNGRPEVSPVGDLVYYFPELQVTAAERRNASVSAYLKEVKRQFTAATSGQVMGAIALGAVNIVGALVLANMFTSAAAQGFAVTGYLALVQSILGILFAYGIAFLAIPLARYYWLLWRNGKIEKRNEERADRAVMLNQLSTVDRFKQKLSFAHQFAEQKVLRADESVYNSGKDLLTQELEQTDRIDAEFQRRLNEI